MDFRPQPAPHQTNHPAPAPAAAAEHHAGPAHHPVKGDRMLKRQKQLILWLIIAILFIAAIGTAIYYVKRYNDSQAQVKKLSSNSQQAVQDQNKQLIDKIGTLTPLPANETPTVATVTDITKLADQPFFANAKNGDKVLIYTQAKKAYLYRPSTNKLINIAPVNLGNNQTSTSTGTTGTAPTSQTSSPSTTKKP